jgi:site-specific DNA-cytosine methylase
MCLNAEAMGRQDAESETLIPVNRCGIDVADTLTSNGDAHSGYRDEKGLIAQKVTAFDTYNQAVTGDVTQTLCSEGDTTKGAAHLVPAVAYDLRGREGGAQFEGPHDTANIRAASGGSSRSYVAQTWAVRRLPPVECERLQGFPDGFTAIPWRKKLAGECPDGPRYKALGNSMAVPVMRWIGERIAMVDATSQALEQA